MLIVSFYTPDYAEHAARLRVSCERFGYRYWIERVEDSEDWVHNCARKGAFVLRALDSTSDSVLWLDADAEIMRPLEGMIDAGADFAVYHDELATNPKWKFRSGTVWFNQSATNLAEVWADACEAKPQRFDQQSLWLAWDRYTCGLVTHWLPLTYCQRFDEPDGVPDPHIVHYQASRTLKRKKVIQ